MCSMHNMGLQDLLDISYVINIIINNMITTRTAMKIIVTHRTFTRMHNTSARYLKMKSTTGSLGRNKTQQANNYRFKLRLR